MLSKNLSNRLSVRFFSYYRLVAWLLLGNKGSSVVWLLLVFLLVSLIQPKLWQLSEWNSVSVLKTCTENSVSVTIGNDSAYSYLTLEISIADCVPDHAAVNCTETWTTVCCSGYCCGETGEDGVDRNMVCGGKLEDKSGHIPSYCESPKYF